DPARRLALLRDEAVTRKIAGDLAGATAALAAARQMDERDPALQQEYAASVLDRLRAGAPVASTERRHAAELLVGLAEAYDGEHGYAYAEASLDVDPGHDRGLQLYIYYGEKLDRTPGLQERCVAYLHDNPAGAMSEDARR